MTTSNLDREMTKELHSIEHVEVGQNNGRGNLLGIQPYMTPHDYRSAETFHARLDSYLATAAARGWINQRTIVVWPEQIGTWLVAAGEKEGVYTAQTLSNALRSLVLRQPLPFLKRLLWAGEKDRVAAALFRLKATQMVQIYQQVFADLSRNYAVTTVAGSIFLPRAQVADGRLVLGEGPLYNMAAVFGPNGTLFTPLVRKIYPVLMENPFISAALPQELPIFDTPVGRLGVLICADSWYPEPYARLKELGVELLAVPSFIAGNDLWDLPWGGYDGAAAPDNVVLTDVGQLCEADAWRKYALRGRLAASGARCGVNVFLRGSLWDLGSCGRSLAVCDAQVTEAESDGAALMNVWL
jgi:predicted amidohydrolase